MADAVISTVKIEIDADTGDSESRINRLNDSLRNLGNSGKTSAYGIKATEKASSGAEKKVAGLSMAVGKLGRAFGRIVLYRALRSAIKAVTDAFSVGLKNAYTFAAGIETAGHRFATAMDGMKMSGSIMKNQLGSAFIGLLAAIAPIVNAIIGLVTRLAIALSQLFGAFTGGTWLRATNKVEDLAGACGGGAAAAKEWKNQLLGFDEINRLEAPDDGGGGGGGGGLDLSGMFEDAELPRWAQFIADHLRVIKDLAIAIGLALATWKIGKFAERLLGIEIPFKKLLGIALAVAGAFLLIRGFIDALNNGINWDNLIEMAGGALLLIGGLALAFGSFGAAIGAIVGGIALVVAAFADFQTKGELTTEALLALEGGIAAIGLGLTLLTGSWIPLAIAAIVGIALAIYKNWGEIKAWLSGLWNGIKDEFSQTWDSIKAKWDEFKTSLSESWNTFSDAARKSFSETWENIKRPFTEAIDAVETKWDEFVTWIEGKWETFKTWWEGLSLGNFHIPLPHLNVSGSFSLNPPSVPSFSIDWYAGGGFPEDGLFMANHSELVGRFSNGKTAVANNEQIVEGISRGVYNAVVSAMSGMSSNRGGGAVVLNVNGREFMRAVYEDGNAVANEHGISLIRT